MRERKIKTCPFKHQICGARAILTQYESRQCKREMRDERDGPNGAGVQVVVQHEEMGSSVFENGALHFRVSSVDNFGTKRFRLALQLKGRQKDGPYKRRRNTSADLKIAHYTGSPKRAA